MTPSKPDYLPLGTGASACGRLEVSTVQFTAWLVCLVLCSWTGPWREQRNTKWRATKSIMSDFNAIINVILLLVVIH